MIVRDERERAVVIEAGKRLARILEAVGAKVAPSVSAEALDDLAEQLIREAGDMPAFLGYTPAGATRPYPASLCVSINEEVVHGIPNETPKTLSRGDIVGLDLGLVHQGIIVDAAITMPVGPISDTDQKMLRATEEALVAGIAAAKPGHHVGDIGYAIQKVIEDAGFAVVKDLGGHGVGNLVHEEPFIANYGRSGQGELLEEGMVLALEPIASAGRGTVLLAQDGYTYRTKDGSRSAHFEHTILLEKGGARIITK